MNLFDLAEEKESLKKILRRVDYEFQMIMDFIKDEEEIYLIRERAGMHMDEGIPIKRAEIMAVVEYFERRERLITPL